jgi:parallel beta-helix repeat protein
LVGVVFVFLVIAFSTSNGVVFQGDQEVAIARNTGQQTIPADSYTLHSPITINSNADFSSQGWPGNGTSINPYVIEGLSINSDTVSISITNTTAYFEVKDCVIFCNSFSLHPGIHFENVVHGTIRNCIISRHYTGISTYDSSSCTLMNNTATVNYWSGFFLNHSDNCTLTNNSAVINSQFGFSLFSSYNCTLTNNTATSNEYGLYLNDSNNFTLMDNTLFDNGLVFEGWNVLHWLHYLSGNTENNKPLGYFKSLTSTIIDGSQYSQVILANCSEMTVKDGVFNNATVGIQLGFCSNCTLMNNTAASNSLYGFNLITSDNCSLTNNSASSNNYGFYLFSSDSCSLMKNSAYGNDYGFTLESSDNCTLVNDNGSNNTYHGVNLRFLNNCNLTNNTAFNNAHNGFYLENVENCILMNNNASNNYNGYVVQFSDYCTFVNNDATSNRGYGIFFDDSEYNTLYLNRLGENAVSNARDDGSFNTWDDGVSSGNYWMDYSGTGTYPIPGDAGSVDNYPFVWKPVTTSPADSMTLILAISVTGIAVVVIVIIVSFRKRRN